MVKNYQKSSTHLIYGSTVVWTNQVLFILFIFKHILIHPSKTTLPCCVLYAGELFITKWHYTAEMEACQHHSAQVGVLTQQTPAPAYNIVADSPVRAAFQRHERLAHLTSWRFTRPHRFTMRRTTCSSAPAYNAAADSSVCSRDRLARD